MNWKGAEVSFIVEFLESRLLLSGHSHHRKHPGRHARAAAAIHANLHVRATHSVAAFTSPATLGPAVSASAVPASWRAIPDIQRTPRGAGFNLNGTTGPVGRTPAQIRGAYGLGQFGAGNIKFGTVEGDGTGQTIAIIDAYDDPNALSDLNAFSTQFGLPLFNDVPGTPTFQVLNQDGNTSPLPNTDPGGPNNPNGTWEEETSLDIEWAHAMAPKANITLIEANDNSDNLYTAVATARSLPGVVAVSMSWGGPEFNGQTTNDATYFTTPAGHLDGAGLTGGITFLASSGDSGKYSPGTTIVTPQYPTSSPNVVSVGGTRLNVSGNAYVSESAWGNSTQSGTKGGGGGGVSARENQPAYQNGIVNAFSTTKRTYPDISLEADPGTGVALYDSWDFGGSTPWLNGFEGGTSLACPLMAGLIAVADQGRNLAGLGSLNGLTQTLPKFYQLAASPSLYAANFHDITTGNNGFAAGTGYDLASGIGSPIANKLVSSLVGTSTFLPQITSFTATPNPVTAGNPLTLSATATDPNAGATITKVAFYRESNGTAGLQTTGAKPDTFVGNGIFSAGAWSFSADTTGLAGGNYTYYAVATDSLAGVSTAASTSVTVVVQVGMLVVAGKTAYFKTDADGVTLDEWINAATPGSGTPTNKVPLSSISGVIFNGSTGKDVLTLDFSAGNFADGFTNGLSANGSSSGANSLVVVGTSGNDTLTATDGNITFASDLPGFNPVAITLANVQAMTMHSGSAGNGLIDVASGAYTVDANTPTGTPNMSVSVESAAVVTFGSNQHLANLTINDGTASVVTSATRRTINADALSINGNGRLDLGGNDLLTLTPFATIQAYILSGYNSPGAGVAGDWNGPGINSGAARSTPGTALGYATNGDAVVIPLATGQSVASWTVLGDANLDHFTDITDLGIVQNNAGSGDHWALGDFNYDGVVDITDLGILQNNAGNSTPN